MKNAKVKLIKQFSKRVGLSFRQKRSWMIAKILILPLYSHRMKVLSQILHSWSELSDKKKILQQWSDSPIFWGGIRGEIPLPGVPPQFTTTPRRYSMPVDVLADWGSRRTSAEVGLEGKQEDKRWRRLAVRPGRPGRKHVLDGRTAHARTRWLPFPATVCVGSPNAATLDQLTVTQRRRINKKV